MTDADTRVRRRARAATRKHDEADTHRRVVAELRLARVPVFHCPNEGAVPVQYRAKLHGLGLESGIPDLIIPVTPPNWGPPRDIGSARIGAVGGVLELKSRHGKVSDAQRRWLEVFAAAQFLVAVPRSIDEARAVLRLWGYLPQDPAIGPWPADDMRRILEDWKSKW